MEVKNQYRKYVGVGEEHKCTKLPAMQMEDKPRANRFASCAV